MLKLGIAILAAGLLTACATPAKPEAAAAPGAVQTASSDPIICREEKKTGSIRSKMVCYTKEQANSRGAAEEKSVRDLEIRQQQGRLPGEGQ